MKQETVKGLVIECLPAALFKVQLENEKEVLCYLAGKMKFNHIRVLVGDEVEIILDPYHGKATNRIVERVDMRK